MFNILGETWVINMNWDCKIIFGGVDSSLEKFELFDKLVDCGNAFMLIFCHKNSKFTNISATILLKEKHLFNSNLKSEAHASQPQYEFKDPLNP